MLSDTVVWNPILFQPHALRQTYVVKGVPSASIKNIDKTYGCSIVESG
jgi:hypothetical protein